ncbi:hypothetical protein B0T10DRAFT_465240 [Thelonectria olida]|uniref:Uncharacterized protein n=1 Tax=Thelonectria olida TaxID=1576542 RepID=A0A9P8VW37_9HYPO|nr:hypothetical protein B0T10DRAFT_465240 [Thelonectria olida]
MDQYRPAREDWIMLQSMPSGNPFADTHRCNSLSSAETLVPTILPPASRPESPRPRTTRTPAPVSSTQEGASATQFNVSDTQESASTTRANPPSTQSQVSTPNERTGRFRGWGLFFIFFMTGLPYLVAFDLSLWPLFLIWYNDLPVCQEIVIAFVASVLECGTAVFFIPWWFRTSLAWKTGNTNLSFSARCIMSFSVTMYAILLFFGLPLAVGIEIGTKAEGTDCSVDATDPVCQIGTIHLFTNAYCQSLSCIYQLIWLGALLIFVSLTTSRAERSALGEAQV